MFYKEHELQTEKGREHLPDPLRQLSFDRNKLASQNMFLKYLIVLAEVGMSRNWSKNFALKKKKIRFITMCDKKRYKKQAFHLNGIFYSRKRYVLP